MLYDPSLVIVAVTWTLVPRWYNPFSNPETDPTTTGTTSGFPDDRISKSETTLICSAP